MDPITVAAHRFLREHETAWRAPPGQKAPPLLRLEAEPSERKSVLKALRLLEWQPDNRFPVSIFEAPFEEPGQWLAQAMDHVRRDVATVDEGLAADGRAPKPLLAAPPGVSPAEVVAHFEALAKHVTPFLEGLVVVLAPSKVADAPAFAGLAKALAERRASSSALRLDVLAPSVPELVQAAPQAARFVVDQAALLSHLRDLGQNPSKGPADEPPPLTPEQKKKVEAELGQPLVSAHAGATLKTLLFDGGVALSENRPKDALKKYRVARMLAELTNLRREALVATMALGTCYATIQNHRGAEAAFKRAREVAKVLERPDVEAQALLGIGFLFMRERRFKEAQALYEEVLGLVPEEHPLHTEAKRLIVACRDEDMSHGAKPHAVRP